MHERDGRTRLTCGRCGLARGAPTGHRIAWSAIGEDGREELFGTRLWLTTECCGGRLLWALNEGHLDVLERFVSSTDRDRDFPSPPGNRGLASKLPKWIGLAANRAELLRAIATLRRRLDG